MGKSADPPMGQWGLHARTPNRLARGPGTCLPASQAAPCISGAMSCGWLVRFLCRWLVVRA